MKWIQKCDDVRAWGEDVYCLQTIPNAVQIGHLLVNGVDQGMLKINAAIGPERGICKGKGRLGDGQTGRVE